VKLSGVNSINWGRIVAQIVYYFKAAAQLGAPTRKTTFTVPTGNFGDIFAGYGAYRMGLPMERLVIAANSNDILARTVDTGRYEVGSVTPTASPSMDIQVASNFERALFEASGRDSAWTAAAMADFARSRRLVLPPAVLEQLRARYSAFSCDDAQTLETIAQVAAETGQVIDPHTAVAACAARHIPASPAPVVVLSTAHPAKFPDAVARATGRPPVLPEGLKRVMDRPERLDVLPNDRTLIRHFISSRLAG